MELDEQEVGMTKTGRWAIALTYRCNGSCRWCNRYLDLLSWPDSDLLVSDIRIGYNRLGEPVKKARVTGGEPTMHPKFSECMTVIGETWNLEYTKTARTCVFTNRRKRRPKTNGWRYRSASQEDRDTQFFPPAASPSDLGLDWSRALQSCNIQRACGRLFDAFGFAFCALAGPIGRVLGIDPYEPRPDYPARDEICRHCVCSAGHRKRKKLKAAIIKGDVEYPTKTYREAFDRIESDGALTLKKFQER